MLILGNKCCNIKGSFYILLLLLGEFSNLVRYLPGKRCSVPVNVIFETLIKLKLQTMTCIKILEVLVFILKNYNVS